KEWLRRRKGRGRATQLSPLSLRQTPPNSPLAFAFSLLPPSRSPSTPSPVPSLPPSLVLSLSLSR
ncbi:hypothetical protein C3L33_01961, partial [Rhododendron williamsianum]